MTSINTFKIYSKVPSATTKGLTFYWGGRVVDNIQINNVSISQPNADSSDNYNANIGGFKRTITFNFIIKNTGSNNGFSVTTNGANVETLGSVVPNTTTLDDQWDLLMDDIIELSGNSDKYKATYVVIVSRATGTKTYSGTLDNIRLAPQDGPDMTGSITLQVGQNFFI